MIKILACFHILMTTDATHWRFFSLLWLLGNSVRLMGTIGFCIYRHDFKFSPSLPLSLFSFFSCSFFFQYSRTIQYMFTYLCVSKRI